jgi:hypothetical protein
MNICTLRLAQPGRGHRLGGPFAPEGCGQSHRQMKAIFLLDQREPRIGCGPVDGCAFMLG